MALDSITPYCTRADIERYLSVPTLTQTVEDDEDQETIDADGVDNIDDAIVMASETINSYLYQKYSYASLARSNLINRWCTILACYEVRQRRGNDVPDQLAERALEIKEQLEKIQEGKGTVPGVPRRMRRQVMYKNTRTDVTYSFRVIRIEKNTSAPWVQPAYPENVDYKDLYNFDRP